MAERLLLNQRMQILMNMSCLRMRGLPYSAVQKDIVEFLSIHADFVVGSIHIIYNEQGRPSGEAFVEMQNPIAAEQCAKKLHLKHMGERYIEVFQCNVQDMMWMLAKSHADQFAAEHLNQLNNNKNKKFLNNNNNNNSYINPPSPPIILTTAPVPTMHGLIPTLQPPPMTTNGFLPQNISPFPIFTSQYPPVLSPLPGCLFPPAYMQHAHPAMPQLVPPMMGQLVNPELIHFQVNEFVKMGDITYVPVTCPEEVPRQAHACVSSVDTSLTLQIATRTQEITATTVS